MKAAGRLAPVAKSDEKPTEHVATLGDFLSTRAGQVAKRLLRASGEELLLGGFSSPLGEEAVLLRGEGLIYEIKNRGNTPTYRPIRVEAAEEFLRTLESRDPQAKEWFLGKSGVAGLVPAIWTELERIAQRVN